MKTNIHVRFDNKLKKIKVDALNLHDNMDLDIFIRINNNISIDEICAHIFDAIDRDVQEDIFKNIVINSIEKRRFDSLFLEANNEDASEYINANKKIISNEYLSTKIIIDNKYNFFDLNLKNELSTLFSKYSNVFIKIPENVEIVQIDDMITTLNFIGGIINKIKKMNLSPLEEIMFIYDFVRDREYKMPKSVNLYYQSYDVNQTILSDRIICLGFANLFNAFLYNLNFKSMVDMLDVTDKSKKYGHARNLVYIEDDKYDVQGLYFFDPTWDSKKPDDFFLFRYKYFCITPDEMIKSNKDNSFKSIFFPTLKSNLSNDFLMSYSKALNDDDTNILCSNDIFTTISYIENLLNCKEKKFDVNLIDSKLNIKEIYEKLKDYDLISSKKLTANTLLEVLCNVRNWENFYDENKFSFDADTLYSIMKNSGWHFEFSPLEQFGYDFLKTSPTNEEIAENDYKKLIVFLNDREIVEKPKLIVEYKDVVNDPSIKTKKKKNKKKEKEKEKKNSK